MAELAVREALALVEEVIIILYQKFERPTNLHDDVEKVQNILEMMHECVRESEDGIGEDRQLFLDVAYLFEDALEKFMLQLVTDETLNDISQQTDDEVADFIRSWKAKCKLSSGFEEIIEKNTSFFERLDSLLQNHISEGGSRSRLGDSFTFSYSDLAEGDQVVGFEEVQEKLLKQLTEEDSKLLTIFIVGPGGSGKSTLVKNVFESEQVKECFGDRKAWVPVPRRPLQLNELLINMPTGLEEEKPALVEQVDDPKAKLRLFPQQKRYLVVLDDVWRKQDLQYIVKALPNGFHGSRIIITSRNSDVASFLSPNYIHDLRSGLSSEKAKDLFCRKAFHDGQGTCPPVLKRSPDHWPTRKSKAFDKSKEYYLSELEECSDKILKWCGGLPLALSEVGTLLAKKPQTQVEWEEFLANIGTEIRPGSSLSIISRILEPSYMDLPNHLKTCFLYLGVFPAHYRIQRERLIRLWVAEGFVKPRRGITVEQVAQGYLNELISRNLVLIAGEREFYEIGDGQEPSCCVVKLVRDFIISKAENFITVLEPNCSTSTSVERIRRLSVHAGALQFLRSGRLDLKHIRTLLVFSNGSKSDLETVLKTSKFVRVIDFKGVSDFPKSVDGLILLKYLSLLGSEITTVPKSIRKLRFLETLELGSMVNELPEEICQLYTLRHLLVSPHRGVKFCGGNIGALSSMQGLALINVRNDSIIIRALGDLKDLRKLGVSHLETKDGKELCNALEKMKHLSTLDVVANSWESLDLDDMQCPPLYLQHLYLEGSRGRLPKWISKLTSLQTLRLKGSDQLNANPLDVLQALPNLMELHLLAFYSGKELVFIADTFKKLMILNINLSERLNLMVVEDKALPMLRELTISGCPNLESLQYGLPVLRELNISHCPNLKFLQYDFPVLRKLTISHRLNMEFLGCGLPVLRELTISHCPNLELHRYGLPLLTELTISHCLNLELHRYDLPMLKELTISHCPNLELRRYDLPMLTELTISHCPNLKSLPDHLPMLKELTISHCPNLKSLYCDLPVLRELTICHCRNLKSLPYGLPVLNSLYKLVLHDMPREFISTLQKDSPYRLMVRHTPDIHSYKYDTLVQDLSENVLSTSNTRPKADHTEKTLSETEGGGIITWGTKTELDLQDLPDGCKANIIWLTSPQDACRLCSISRDFKSATESDADWDKFLPPETHTILSQSAEPGLVARSKRELYLTLCDNPVLIGKGKMSFSLDKWSGKKCYMISARDLHIIWGSTPQYWTWTSDPESRFEEVAELLEVRWLEIHGKLDARLLSPSTLYKAYLVFKFTTRAHGFVHLPAQVTVGLEGEETTKQTVFIHNKGEVNQSERESDDDQYQKERSDGWLEIELGDFFCGGGEDGQLNMICLNTSRHWKRGLIVEGIEVRPKRKY